MKSRWDDAIAQQFQGDPLALRVYTSRLLGQEPDLVLHGGGNTSVKARVTNFFGDPEEVLYVKGSGWDLATIEAWVCADSTDLPAFYVARYPSQERYLQAYSNLKMLYMKHGFVFLAQKKNLSLKSQKK